MTRQESSMDQRPLPEFADKAACEAYLNARMLFKRGREIQLEDMTRLLDLISRADKEAMLLAMLPEGSEIKLPLTDYWLDQLLMFNPAVLLEAQRISVRLAQTGWHPKRAEAEGPMYWLRIASSYGGDK